MKKNVKSLPSEVRSRGRPRSKTAKRAILRAAQVLLSEGGPGAVTMEEVAARAGVGKPTVYRWWPDRYAVTMAALMEMDVTPPVDIKRRSAVFALREQLRAIARRFATATGRHIASMIAASEPETELSKAFRSHFVLARRTEGKNLLDRAIAGGEVRSDLNIEVTLDMLYGPLFFRLLVGHAPLDERFMDQVLDEALRGMDSHNRAPTSHPRPRG